MRSSAYLLIVCLIAVAAGCTNPQYFARPNWLDPGNAERQQLRAERFDPYPEADTGPEVVGGRPRDYQVPVSEPERVQRGKNRFGIYP